MARASVGITTQLGVESSYGTDVTAAKQLSSTGVMFGPRSNSSFYRQVGNKFPTTGVKHREWAVGSYNGILSYNEIVYILAGIFGHGTVTQIGATAGYTWPISPSSTAADTIKTYTLQRGDSTAAQEVNGAAFTSLTIDFAQEGVNVSGDVLGRTLNNGATLDTVTTVIAESPVSMSDVDVYLDATYGGIGVTKWTDVLSASLTIPAKVSPRFVLNTTFKSIRDLVEVALEDARLVVRAENNTQTRSFYDAMYTDSLPFRFIQIKAIGDNIGASADYTFKGNFAVKLESVNEIENIQETYGMEFNFRLVHNPTMARALEFTVINTLTGL